ncbi:MAG: cellulase family glycosylhydrolase [Rectinemataceae bacterium]|nr:cellulase family glycosylhydrolase [Rectinemataceae bacterium]
MEIRGDHFTDEAGRSLILRGLNLGGNCKVPVSPDGRTHIKEGFYKGKDLSFVGRPFPAAECDEHFARLAGWGQRFERFLVTWEAVEHEGPGIYDTAYLDYLETIIDGAARHGISLFIDPHQDVWSRWSGGDGAPLWTLEACGFEARNFKASGAALLHQEMGPEYPQMQWFSNHLRLACATMFTLFFAGDDFAPGIEIEGRPAQRFLQDHYIAAMREIALRLAKYPNVVGIDSMNEPGTGFIGIGDARVRRQGFSMPGLAPTPWETMLAGEGFPVEVDRVGVRGLGLKVIGRALLGSAGIRAWKDDAACVWRRADVWDIESGKPVLKDPGRFAAASGAFNECWLKPFVKRFAAEIRAASSATSRSTAGFAIFVEGAAQGENAPSWTKDDPAGIVNSTHWYDAFTLSFKLWTGFLAFDTERGKAVIGSRAVRAYFREAFARIALHSRNAMGGVPSIVGEFGLPFDMNGRKAFRTGNFRLQEKALSAYYDALDANLMNATLWNYAADNTHEWGDGWNGEDLSVFCKEDGGGRALAGFVRPYAYATAGRIVEMSFKQRSGEFRLRFLPDATIAAPTEVFVPRLQYPEGYALEVSGCVAAERRDEGEEENSASPIWLDLKPEPGAAECCLIMKRRR